MQLFSRNKALLALSLGALAALGACGDDVTVTEAVTPVTVAITPPSANMNVGESLNFAVQISGGSATAAPTLASCSSSNSAVATATVAGSACRVTAVAAGNATVTAAASSGQSAAASITVAAPAAAINTLTVSPTSASLAVNQTVTIVPNVNKAAAAVTTSNSYTSSNAAIATVNASGVVTAVAPGVATITVSVTGQGTGYTTTTLTGAATVTVTALPSGITALNVQPTTLAMALGSTAQLAASVQQPQGAAAATITYGTTVPSVATVSSAGVVTAVAPGSAQITVTATSAANTNFAASTLTQLVAVTVSPSATVTILAITQGPVVTSYVDSSNHAGLVTAANPQTDQSVDVTNVRDQIQVVLNLQPNGQRVDSVVVFIANADGSANRAAARQLYSNGTANAGVVTLYVNTADFTVDFATGASDVFYKNGQKLISASVFTTQGTTVVEQQNAQNNRQTVNFNNLDGYAARYVSPTRSAINATSNLTFWGGPDAAGTGSYSIVPVFYTPNRSVTRADIRLRQGLASSAAICNAIERYTALPFSGTYNNTTGASPIDISDRVIECSLYEHANAGDASNFVSVEAGTDNYNNTIPTVTRVDGYRVSAQVARIVANRLDYRGPSTTKPDIRRQAPDASTLNAIWGNPAVTGWVNAAFNFQNNTDASTDAGIGLPTMSSRSWNYSGCGASKAALPTQSGADIAECSSDNQGGWDPTATADGTYGLKTRGPYTAAYTETDVLLNSTTSASSSKFGVDKTAPLVRFSTASAADTSWGSASRTMQAEVIDERSGFVDNNDMNAVLVTTGRNSYTLNSTTYGSFQHFATRGASSANPATLNRASSNNVNCINPNSLTAMNTSTSNPFSSTTSTANGGSTPITNPSCPFINQGNTLGGMLADGYRPVNSVTFSSPGIYSYRAKIYDRAGNVSAVLARSTAVDNGPAPTFGDLNVPASISASSAPVFGAQISDDVEARAYNLSLLWNGAIGGQRFIYPQTLLNARFNDEVVTPFAGNIGLQTGAPFITALETTTGTIPSFSSTPLLLSNVTDIQGTGFDVNNAASGAYTTSFGAVSLANLYSISGVNGSSSANFYTNWTVLNTQASLQPAFLAPAGLKAQLTGNTNVPNPPFSRVEYFRWNASTSLYEFIGQATSAAQEDHGTTRFWTWTLTSDAYAKTPTSLETTQRQVAVNDRIIAIGVRSNGAGLATDPAGITIGGEAIAISVTGLPAGAPASITISNGLGYTQTVTGAGTYIVPAAGTYFVTGALVTYNNQSYSVSSVTPSGTVVVASNSVGAATVNYVNATTMVSVSISGIVGGGNPPFTITGPNGFSQTISTQSNGTQSYVVPGPGTYTVTPAVNPTLNGYVHTSPAAVTGLVVALPPAAVPNAALAYTNTTNHIQFNVSGLPAGLSVPSSSCSGLMGNGANFTQTGATTSCTLSNPTSAFHAATNSFYTTTFANPYPANTLALGSGQNGAPAYNVVYTQQAANITVNLVTAGGLPNNLPNGIPYVVRFTSSVYASSGGFQDFNGVTGKPLVVSAPPGTYNVSIAITQVSGGQTWTGSTGNTTASGGTGTNVVTTAGTNIVVQNIIISNAPTVPADIQATVNFGLTGPTGTP